MRFRSLATFSDSTAILSTIDSRAQQFSAKPNRGKASPRHLASVRFDWVMTVLCGLFQAGIYLDGWAHLHVPQLETFFTPWHGVLYSAFAALSVLLMGRLIGGRRKSIDWRSALPAGYGLSLIGCGIFCAAGLADMLWHTFFGIEADVEALLSPTHLVLACAGLLICAGPLRSGWQRSEFPTSSWVAQLPMILSLSFVLSSLAFFTQYAHPIARPWAALGNRPLVPALPVQAADPAFDSEGLGTVALNHAMGVASVLLQTGLLMGVVLMALVRRNWSLPIGSLTILFTVNAALMGLMRDQVELIPAAALAGVAADFLLIWFKPTPTRTGALRFFAFAAPTTYYLLHFVSLKLTKGIWWSVHVWTGAIILAGIAGWLLSYLVVATRVSQEDDLPSI
jgi:hypothetical protein